MTNELSRSRELKLRADLSGAIHAALKRQQLTQTELANRSGVNMSHISSIMNDKVSPKLETIAKIEAGLGIPIVSFESNRTTKSLI